MVRTLLVEEGGSFRALLKSLLLERFPQLEIEVADDGEQAVRLAKALEPHLVFMDIRLPSGNGLGVAADIKTWYPRVVIIALGSQDLPEYRNAVQRFSIDHFLSKDASLETVFELVEEILSSVVLA